MAEGDDKGRRRQRIRDRFGVLLVFLVASFLTLGAADSGWARVVAGTMELGALAVAFLSTALFVEHRWLRVFAAFGLVVVVLAPVNADGAQGASAVASAMVLAAMLVAVLDRVLRHKHVTEQTLFGAVCAYFLIGLTFSSIYAAIDAFGSQPLFGEVVPKSVYSYFSFTTLTTVGFGDYTAKTAFAQRFVAIEAVLGPVFLATTLARLVSLYNRSASTDT